MTTDPDAPILSNEQLSGMISNACRKRIIAGDLRPGDVAKLRGWAGLSQARFAALLNISIDTLQNWEQDRRQPDGPAKSLLRLFARHPGLLLRSLEKAA